MPYGWSKKDYGFIDKLKSNTAAKAAELSGYSPKYAFRKLAHMRKKYREARHIVNIYDNWKKHPRLAKLLRDGGIEQEGDIPDE